MCGILAHILHMVALCMCNLCNISIKLKPCIHLGKCCYHLSSLNNVFLQSDAAVTIFFAAHFYVATIWGQGSILVASVFTLVSYLFLPRFPPKSWPFWHCNNEASRPTTALGTINLRKVYTNLFKQDLLIAFPNGTDVCAQATPLMAFLKREKLHF